MNWRCPLHDIGELAQPSEVDALIVMHGQGHRSDATDRKTGVGLPIIFTFGTVVTSCVWNVIMIPECTLHIGQCRVEELQTCKRRSFIRE
jgi:hypothetical protein